VEHGSDLEAFDLGRASIERSGAPYCTIHLGNLYNALHCAVLALEPEAVHLGHQASGFIAYDDGVTLHFTGGAPDARGYAIVVADGVYWKLPEAAGVAAQTKFLGVMLGAGWRRPNEAGSRAKH